MAVITRNGKRPQQWRTLNHTYLSPNSSDSHKSKRPRFSSMPQNPTGSPLFSNSSVSRISRYPLAKPPLHREVHAPCKPRKFDFLTISTREIRGNFQKEGVDNNMGNVLSNNYQRAKNSALSSFRFLRKGKDVIDVDTDTHKDAVYEDSSIEEVQIIEDGREGRSVVTGQRLQESPVVVTGIPDWNAKVIDGGLLQQQSTSPVVSELINSNLKAVNAGNMLDSFSLSPGHDLSSVHVYKRLLEAVGRRTDTIKRLSLEIELNEKRRTAFDLLRPKKELIEEVPYEPFVPLTKEEEIEEVPYEPFVPLTKEEEIEVKHAFSANWKKVLVMHGKSNIEITGEKFQCLRPGAWLNDEVINLYLELLKERERREPQKFLKCHFFNTFFYKKLISGRNGYDFKSVRRWTSERKLGYGLHDCDKIFVPIHKEVHWCLAIINKKDEKFQYLDSLKGMDTQVLKVLARYFVDEVKDKTGKDIDVSFWEKEFVEDLPEQENGYDCGVFMIKYVDFYSRDVGLCFSQEHMPCFRLRTAKEILRLKAE